MPYLKPVLAGLLASAITYLCFLTWLHWKAVSLVKEQRCKWIAGANQSSSSGRLRLWP